jgi:hypothetical protein
MTSLLLPFVFLLQILAGYCFGRAHAEYIEGRRVLVRLRKIS